jgi:uncharacterized protein (DUF305 family)
MTRTVLTRIAALLAAAVLGAVVSAAVFAHREPPPVLSSIDIGFAQDMSMHHQQAVTMADMLAPDAAPDVRALAEQIRFTQLAEIGQMTGWLQLVGAPPAGTHPMAWMTPTAAGHDMNPMNDAMTMPGLASPADLTRLQRSTGHANEVLFLELMTRHHEGGIDMATYAFRHSTTDAVRRAASIMVDEQTQEIQLLTIMLNERHDGGS